jgi:hypothetical protein
MLSWVILIRESALIRRWAYKATVVMLHMAVNDYVQEHGLNNMIASGYEDSVKTIHSLIPGITSPIQSGANETWPQTVKRYASAIPKFYTGDAAGVSDALRGQHLDYAADYNPQTNSFTIRLYKNKRNGEFVPGSFTVDAKAIGEDWMKKGRELGGIDGAFDSLRNWTADNVYSPAKGWVSRKQAGNDPAPTPDGVTDVPQY